MYIYEKSELTEHPMFEQSIMLCEMQTNAKWLSIYKDPTNELAITFKGILNKSQIKTILMHFKDLIDGDANTDNISLEEETDFSWDYNDNTTRIFTPDGYDYSQF